MIKILMGPKGTGKSKAFIEMVNTAVNEEKGNIVCITVDKRHLFDLKSSIRLINTDEYNINCYDTLYGFICGIISSNYDVTHIFIDSITKVVTPNFEQLDELLVNLENISEKTDVNFTITISSDVADATDTVKKYLVSI